jgi:hypothetical protein
VANGTGFAQEGKGGGRCSQRCLRHGGGRGSGAGGLNGAGGFVGWEEGVCGGAGGGGAPEANEHLMPGSCHSGHYGHHPWSTHSSSGLYVAGLHAHHVCLRCKSNELPHSCPTALTLLY